MGCRAPTVVSTDPLGRCRGGLGSAEWWSIEVKEVIALIFVGNDWAEDHHDVHVMNEAGKKLAGRRLPEGVAGSARSTR